MHAQTNAKATNTAGRESRQAASSSMYIRSMNGNDCVFTCGGPVKLPAFGVVSCVTHPLCACDSLADDLLSSYYSALTRRRTKDHTRHLEKKRRQQPTADTDLTIRISSGHLRDSDKRTLTDWGRTSCVRASYAAFGTASIYLLCLGASVQRIPISGERVADGRNRSRSLSPSAPRCRRTGKERPVWSREAQGASAGRSSKHSPPKERGCVSRSRRDLLSRGCQVFTCSRNGQQLHETLANWKDSGYDVQVPSKNDLCGVPLHRPRS